MKKTALVLSCVLALSTSALFAATSGKWTGWITDAHCGEKGTNADHKTCATKCKEKGQALVFYCNADKKTYKIDKQDLAKEHLGAEVEVTGEATGDSIKVASIKNTK